jgi:branched-chain amino acid aminotransferase
MIAVFPLRWTVASMGKLFDEGINAIIPSQRSLSTRHIDPKIKNRSRIHYLMANIETSLCKGENNWALLLDEDGYISEGTGDNFFIVKNGKVITPEGRNILRGISRDYIFELCKLLHIEYIEKNIEPYDVYTADEAFMTGTPFCMLPVTSLNGVKIGTNTNTFDLLLKYWSKSVGINIKEQIQNWNTNEIIQGATPYQFK